jgi:hypothetical protein
MATTTPHRLLDAPQVADIVLPALPADERQWVPLNDGVWFHPLQLDITRGSWTNLLKVVPHGRLACHAHPNPVHAYTLQGSWGYLEHDWAAHAGDYVYEPPGEVHTLVVGAEGMITIFNTTGSVIYVDPDGTPTGYDTVHTRIDAARRHYRAVGLDTAHLDSIIR